MCGQPAGSQDDEVATAPALVPRPVAGTRPREETSSTRPRGPLEPSTRRDSGHRSARCSWPHHRVFSRQAHPSYPPGAARTACRCETSHQNQMAGMAHTSPALRTRTRRKAMDARRLVPDLESPVLHCAGDPDPWSARGEALVRLIVRLFPDSAQVIYVDGCVNGRRDSCSTKAQLQFDGDHRILDDGPGQIEIDLAVLGFDLENLGNPHMGCSAPIPLNMSSPGRGRRGSTWRDACSNRT